MKLVEFQLLRINNPKTMKKAVFHQCEEVHSTAMPWEK